MKGESNLADMLDSFPFFITGGEIVLQELNKTKKETDFKEKEGNKKQINKNQIEKGQIKQDIFMFNMIFYLFTMNTLGF